MAWVRFLHDLTFQLLNLYKYITFDSGACLRNNPISAAFKSSAVLHRQLSYAVVSDYQLICKPLGVSADLLQSLAFQSQLTKCLYMHKYTLCHIVRTS